MTTRIARMFATPQAAVAAADALRAQGFPEASITIVGRQGAADTIGNDLDAITARIMAAFVLKAHAKRYAEAVLRGGSLVIVRAPWGTAVRAQEVMERFGPIETGIDDPRDPPRAWDDKRPLSSALGLKLLGGSAAPVSELLNVPLLSRVAAPLSDALHVGLLTKVSASLSKAIGLPMVTKDGRSLSEAVGVPAVSRSGRSMSEVIGLPTRSEGLGFPSVMPSARPVSEALGLPTVSKRGRSVSEVLGIPTLTSGRGAMSEGIGIPTLIQRKSASV